jgi:hypothetical protein
VVIPTTCVSAAAPSADPCRHRCLDRCIRQYTLVRMLNRHLGVCTGPLRRSSARICATTPSSYGSLPTPCPKVWASTICLDCLVGCALLPIKWNVSSRTSLGSCPQSASWSAAPMAHGWSGHQCAARTVTGSAPKRCSLVTSRAVRVSADTRPGHAWHAVRWCTGRRYVSTAASSPAPPRCGDSSTEREFPSDKVSATAGAPGKSDGPGSDYLRSRGCSPYRTAIARDYPRIDIESSPRRASLDPALSAP